MPSRDRIVAVAVALGLLVALAGCGSDATTASTSDATTEPSIEGLVRDEPLQVGEATLPEVAPDGSEAPFAFRAPDGGLLFVAFGYTYCPDVCPTTLSDLRKALAQLEPADAARVSAAFATVDPDRDTAEVLTGYLSSFVEDGHALRTDDPAALEAAEDAFGVTSSVVERDGQVEVAHTGRSFIVDDQGDVVVEWAFGTGPDAMANDLQLLLDRAAAS